MQYRIPDPPESSLKTRIGSILYLYSANRTKVSRSHVAESKKCGATAIQVSSERFGTIVERFGTTADSIRSNTAPKDSDLLERQG